jgi:hypothetical protein
MKHAKIMWAAMTKPQWRLQVKNVAIAGQNAALLAAVGQPMRERTIVVQVRKRSSFRSNEMPSFYQDRLGTSMVQNSGK